MSLPLKIVSLRFKNVRLEIYEKATDNCRESMNSLENITGSGNCSQFTWFCLTSEMASEWHLRIKKKL